MILINYFKFSTHVSCYVCNPDDYFDRQWIDMSVEEFRERWHQDP